MRHIEFEARTWLHLHLHSRYCHLHQVFPYPYPDQVHLPLTEFAPFFRGQQVEDAPPLDLTKVIILDFIFVTSWVFSPDRSIWPPDFWWSVRRLQAVRRWLSWDRLRLPLLISLAPQQSILYVWINVTQKTSLLVWLETADDLGHWIQLYRVIMHDWRSLLVISVMNRNEWSWTIGHRPSPLWALGSKNQEFINMWYIFKSRTRNMSGSKQ